MQGEKRTRHTILNGQAYVDQIFLVLAIDLVGTGDAKVRGGVLQHFREVRDEDETKRKCPEKTPSDPSRKLHESKVSGSATVERGPEGDVHVGKKRTFAGNDVDLPLGLLRLHPNRKKSW